MFRIQIMTAFLLCMYYNTDMIIYLDVVFIENLLMNYIILFSVGLIQRNKIKSYKLIISSMLGALYVIISYLNIIPIYSNIIMKVLLSLLMIYLAFYPQNIKKMCKSLLLFYLVSFVIGGCAFALLYIISPQRIIFRNGVLVGTYPIKITLIAGLIGFVIIQISFKLNKRLMKKSDLICKLEIKVYEKTICTNAFIDSGNSLKDPITKDPVVIIEKNIIQKIIDIEKIMKKGGDDNIRIRLIPFKSIGKQNGVLIGIQSDYIKIIKENEQIIIDKPILGIYEKKINKEYSALIGLDLLEKNNIQIHKCKKGILTR